MPLVNNTKLYEELKLVKCDWVSTGSKVDRILFPAKISKLLTKYDIDQEGFIAYEMYHKETETEISPKDKKVKSIIIARGIVLNTEEVRIHIEEQSKCPKCGVIAYRNWKTTLEYELGFLRHHKCNSCKYNEIVPELSKSTENSTYEVLRVDTDGSVIYC